MARTAVEEKPTEAAMRAGGTVREESRMTCPRCHGSGLRNNWRTPGELDRERMRYRSMKPQRGGWRQSLWIVLQEEWRRTLVQGCRLCGGWGLYETGNGDA